MEFTERNLVESMLTAEEIIDMARSLELKAMGEEELAAVMATEPTLIKRPIVKVGQGYVIGLDEEKIRELLEVGTHS